MKSSNLLSFVHYNLRTKLLIVCQIALSRPPAPRPRRPAPVIRSETPPIRVARVNPDVTLTCHSQMRSLPFIHCRYHSISNAPHSVMRLQEAVAQVETHRSTPR